MAAWLAITTQSLRFIALGLVVSAPLFPADDLAPASQYEGKPIERVVFEPESQPVARAELDRLVPFRPGAPLNLSEARDFIQRLYATGFYDYVEVDANPEGAGIAVVVRTTTQWFVGAVDVRGKVKYPPNEGQLSDAARLDLGTPFDEQEVQTAVDGIRDLFQRNGLYRFTVVPRVTRDTEHQEIGLTFEVDAGPRARFTLPVVLGDTSLPPDELARAARYKGWLILPWKRATAVNTQRGLQNVRRKFEKDDRLTASVALDRMDYLAPENRVRPVIRAAGGPKIKLDTVGAKISRSKLERYVPVLEEGLLDRQLLVQGVGNLRDYYQDQGYFDVLVDFRNTHPEPDREQVTYTVQLGERHKVARVEIRGNRYFATRDIRDRLYVQPAGFLILRHGRYSAGLAGLDTASITALYRANGFRDVKVAVRTLDNYRGKKGDVAVIYNITEGPQYLVSNLTADGLSPEDRETTLKRLASRPGAPFSETNVALDRDYLITQFQSKGYPDVSFSWQMANGGKPNQVSVKYIITPGPERFVRGVLIYGNRATSERLLAPNILLRPGEPLSWTRMGEMQRRLYDLGVFDRVNMAIQNPEGDAENKYVLYQLTEGHRYYTAIGIGAELARIGGSPYSLDNPAGTTGISPRLDFDATRINMFGLGHTLTFRSRYSTLDRRVSLDYLAPRFHNVEGRNITVGALYDDERDVLTFTAQRYEGSTLISQRFSKAIRGQFGYVWRDVRVDQSSLKINPLLIPLESQPARIAMLRANLIQDRRDDPANAHRGIYNTADIGLVDHDFGGSKNFLRFLGQSAFYKPVFSASVIASNTKFGLIRPFSVTSGVTPFDYVPIPEHFFGGGTFDDRGFNDFQAGPRDLVTGFPLGGNALFFHQTEFRFPFLGENIGGVLFHDFGNIFQDLGSISFSVHQKNIQDFNYMVHAVGFGIRYRTPVGPVRVDLAYSINPPTFFGLKGTYDQLLFGGATPQIQNISHFQFFFSIGQAF